METDIPSRVNSQPRACARVTAKGMFRSWWKSRLTVARAMGSRSREGKAGCILRDFTSHVCYLGWDIYPTVSLSLWEYFQDFCKASDSGKESQVRLYRKLQLQTPTRLCFSFPEPQISSVPNASELLALFFCTLSCSKWVQRGLQSAPAELTVLGGGLLHSYHPPSSCSQSEPLATEIVGYLTEKLRGKQIYKRFK